MMEVSAAESFGQARELKAATRANVMRTGFTTTHAEHPPAAQLATKTIWLWDLATFMLFYLFWSYWYCSTNLRCT